MCAKADIEENEILALSPDVLNALLKDHSTKKNIFWATDDYAAKGDGYRFLDEITAEKITGENGLLIQPRAKKSREIQQQRVQEKAEVFTPAWICNAQNNLVDNVWFGREGVFNTENSDKTWRVNSQKVEFPEGKTWQDYVLSPRLEITCGEAPYITSRYDAVNCDGVIPVKNRIGFLDRKLRIVNENTSDKNGWLVWAFNALHSVYGFEFQGDSLLLAREAVLYTFKEHFYDKFQAELEPKVLENAAYIISWNIWQMDGLKGVVPMSCHDVVSQNKETSMGAFDFPDIETQEIVYSKKKTPCPGCKDNRMDLHNGIKCLVKDWVNKKETEFYKLIK